MTSINRRSFLTTIGAVAGATSIAGCSTFDHESDAATTEMSEERARELAEQFAPTLYFDEHEQWFPTDPRAYTRANGEETVVDGFEALDGYTEGSKESDAPPDPTVFFHAMEYEDSPLAVVQFWYYSVFDQFTTNFHWHDWEVLHVFVDTDSGEPQLYVGSSHSSSVPNNEFLDPETQQVPRILSELGSHSSALSVNDVADRFQRLPIDGTIADITNSAIESIENIANIPLAYGLPRDEGSRLPYVVPELDDKPLYEHGQLPSVSRDDLVAEELTIRSFADLTSPPGDLADRSTGVVFQSAGRDEEVGDVEYDLVPTRELEHITDFSGPQLSFEFAIPAFAEDAIASHISTTGVPWEQPRYNDPAADISDSNHRAVLADRYSAIAEPASVNTVITNVTEAISSDKAPDGEGVTTGDLSVESIALLESNAEAVPTFNGIAVVRDVQSGEHRLTVNAPGAEPHSETLVISTDGSGPTSAGAEGNVPLVARENAMKLEVGTNESETDLTDLVLEDDFAGRLYDAPLDGPDAVYVHRGGAYTTEVRDAEGEVGAYRINPSTENYVRLEAPRTGKESLSNYLADIAGETATAVEAAGTGNETGDTTNGGTSGGQNNAIQGLTEALEAVVEAAQRAANDAANGNKKQANQNLDTVIERLERVQNRLDEAAEDLPKDLERAIGHRLDQSQKRSNQALAAKKL
ncbi:MAG: hypothetical protein V5A26_10315 [Halodesulfurarchaeum sp.]